MKRPDWIRAGLLGSTEPMSGLGDLALFLGGSADSFTGRLLELIVKAHPVNRDRLRLGFPDIVHTWEVWMSISPAPTADQLSARLARVAPRREAS